MKRLSLLGALVLSTLLGFGCDVCGIFLGLQPNDRTSTIGLWYRMRYLEGHLGPFGPIYHAKHGGAATPSAVPTHYAETFQTMELRGDIWLSQRWALMGSLPLVNNYASAGGITSADIYGMGDPLFLGRFVAINTKCGTDTARTRHRLTFGAGGKLPLGRHDLRYNGEPIDHDLQPGTGTFDGLFSVEYLLRQGAWGMGLSGIGRWNGESADGFRAGRALNATAELFRVMRCGALTWMPSAGVYDEHAGRDRQFDVEDAGTGGSTLFTHVSSRVWWRSWGLSFTWQHAVAWDQGDRMVPNRERVLAGITYQLN